MREQENMVVSRIEWFGENEHLASSRLIAFSHLLQLPRAMMNEVVVVAA